MTLSEAYQISFAVLSSIGVGGATVFALSSWLGKVWANRILEQDRAHYRRAMQEAEHEARRTLERLKTEGQKRVHVHRLQFEAEFRAYQEIWEALSQATIATLQLRPVHGSIDTSKSSDERKSEKLNRYREGLNLFTERARRNLPFLGPPVASEVEILARLLQQEGFAFQFGGGDVVGVRKYWDEQKENREKIETQIDKIQDEIRKRIGLLEVVE